MRRIILLYVLFQLVQNNNLVAQQNDASSRRDSWLVYLDNVCKPLLTALSTDSLKIKMPVVLSPVTDNAAERKKYAYLEAFGRTFSGIAPWLQSEGGSAHEVSLRNEYRQLCIKAIAHAVDSTSKDYMLWNKGGQPLVDASFLALGLIRCPWLWKHSDKDVQQNIVNAFTSTRIIKPGANNWILFSSMIEAFFCNYDLPYDKSRIDYGVYTFMHKWYVGDGMFGDGASFHLDYYNSYVIQPYLLNIINATNDRFSYPASLKDSLDKITKRYAEIQERSINSDGSFAATGRSITYRSGAFHHLAEMALRNKLPQSISAAQVRCALFSVIEKTLSPTSFTKDGWLNIGMVAEQPGLANAYINTGSLYLCTEIFLPLGLSADDPFWKDADAAWTSKKIWSGKDAAVDHAMELD